MSTRDAKVVSARGALRAAIAAMEVARGPLRSRERRRAEDEWRAVADRCWSIVDHHELDGRQYLIVVGNRPVSPGIEVLTPRELQVLAAAAIGQTNKVIAYELGLSDSTVRVLLARSAKKLGVKKRVELVALYLAHTTTRALAI
jgi:DNA-binding NarL/FixJ family response regulator